MLSMYLNNNGDSLGLLRSCGIERDLRGYAVRRDVRWGLYAGQVSKKWATVSFPFSHAGHVALSDFPMRCR